MSAHKNIDRICIIITVFTMIIGLVFCNGSLLGIQSNAKAIGYENRLFDNSKVHKIDIVIDDWDGFLENCESEQYSECTVVIDGEAVKNVGLRAKGNTSLSSVKNMDSSRYSFKIEFDHYENGKSYHGLDKLCLNNIIQDNTYMKDYIAYNMMKDFGVDAPLCSYADIYVNGEEWGLYLAVESIEDSFLNRNYGSQYGDLYKPDSMSFGGGRGNGMDFDMGDFSSDQNNENSNGGMPDFSNGGMPDFSNGEMPDFSNGGMPDFSNGGMPDMKGGGFGMGSDDVKLKYTDDEFDSYSNIFNNAKTTVTSADKKRLISSLKALYEQSDIESTVNVNEVLRYFVVHNFLVNGDSYTGSMIHNYYLYEKDGQLSMIPWDYNLAFGTFQGGNATSSVNYPIDTPVQSGDLSDRPMVSWIFDNEEYTQQYHQLFSEFLNSVDFEKFIDQTAEMIDKYVQNDATKFCTYDEFKKGVEVIKQFCVLRSESVEGQLKGTIPSTSDGQNNSSSLIDASDINTSDMGSMNTGGGFGGGFGGGKDSNSKGGFGGNVDENFNNKGGFNGNSDKSEKVGTELKSTSLSNISIKLLANSPQGSGGFDPNNMPDGFDPSNMPSGGRPGNIPDDFDPSNMPSDFNPNNTPSDFNPNNTPENSNSDGKPEDDNSESTTDNVGQNDKPDNSSTDDSTISQGTQNDRAQGGRGDKPQMNDFNPNSTGQSKTDTKTEAILLAVSVIILLGGLGFAIKFKR